MNEYTQKENFKFANTVCVQFYEMVFQSAPNKGK